MCLSSGPWSFPFICIPPFLCLHFQLAQRMSGGRESGNQRAYYLALYLLRVRIMYVCFLFLFIHFIKIIKVGIQMSISWILFSC